MITSKTILFLAIAGAASTAMAAEAEDTPPAPAVFVQKAAQDGMTEVELGKIALDKSQNAEIRSFAQRMVADHGKANDELKSLAGSNGLDVPKKLDAEHQAIVNDMKSMEGAKFDSTYARHMNMDHTKAIALFEAESKADNKDLAGFADKTLPTLKEHKALAKKLPKD